MVKNFTRQAVDSMKAGVDADDLKAADQEGQKLEDRGTKTVGNLSSDKTLAPKATSMAQSQSQGQSV